MKQVLVQLRDDAWEVREMMAGYYALLDGEVLSLHQVTLAYEQRELLPQEGRLI
jgi:hypothetical protein